jgi:DNA-binding NtrC family response regulator
MKALNVLVVDDEEVVRNAISGLLTVRAGYCVCSASDGAEALRVLKSTPCDVVVLDLLMPGKDGIEFLSELHRDFPKVKVVAISGALPALKFVETPDIPILEKPFEIDALISTIERLRQSKSGVRQAAECNRGN